MLKLPLIISDKNLWLRCSSSGRRVSACASVTTHYPPGRLVGDVGQCTEWRARCSGKVPTSTWKIKICTLVAKISLMVSLFSLEKSLKLPSVRIFADKQCWNFLTRRRVRLALCTSTVLSNMVKHRLHVWARWRWMTQRNSAVWRRTASEQPTPLLSSLSRSVSDINDHQ